MSDKSLKDKAIKFKGKDYVMVSERVIYFNEKYLAGCIQTELLSDVHDEEIVMRAKVYPDIVAQPNRIYTGYSQAVKGQGYINQTSALENCETSAIGRALAMMGIGVLEGIASIDEINKANSTKPYQPRYAAKSVNTEPEWKIKIKHAVDSIDPLLETKEQYESFVFDKTGLQLKEENAADILSTLKTFNQK